MDVRIPGSNVDFRSVTEAFTKEFQEFGDSAQGVCWRNEELQHLRFDNFVKLIPLDAKNFWALDFGCGTGAFVPWLQKRGMKHYVGVEINPLYLSAAKAKYPQYSFIEAVSPAWDRRFDYVFACGALNYCGTNSREEWEVWVRDQLQLLWKLTGKAMAVNFLTTTPEYREEGLWYPNSQEEVVSWLGVPNTRVVSDYWKHEWMIQAFREEIV